MQESVRPIASVIIPVYNQLPMLLKCLHSLMPEVMARRVELILADDCSPEFDLTELPLPPAKVLRASLNQGFAATCNAGASAAETGLLFFLNSDTQARPGWLDAMAATFTAHERAVIVGPRLLFPNDGKNGPPDSIQSCGGLFDAGKGPYHRFIGMHKSYPAANKEEKVSWTTGAALMIKRDAFAAVGGFDVGYKRGYFEDVHLCMAAREQGGEVWYTPHAEFVHHVGSSTATAHKTPAEMREAQHSFQRNSYRFHHAWDENIVPDSQGLYVNY